MRIEVEFINFYSKMTIIKRLFSHVAEDMLQNAQRILLLVLLISAVHFYIYLIKGLPFIFFAYTLANVICLVSAFWIFTSFLPSVVRKGVRLSVFLLTLVCSVANFGCYIYCGYQITDDLFYVIAGTNLQETREFLSTYFSVPILILIIFTIFLILAAYFKPLFRIDLARWSVTILAVVVIGSAVLSSRDTLFTRLSPVRDLILLHEYEPTPDLTRYRHSLTIDEMESEPMNIVLIIGESFARSHSSLYGYPFPTNPGLKSMVNDGLLTVYENVTSPETYTTQSFQKILMLNRPNDSREWYERITLFDIFDKQYQTYWLSNQNRTGLFENVQGKLSDLVDQLWYSERHVDFMQKDYDEVLLSPLAEVIKDDAKKRLIIINLIGQHEYFGTRYPEKFYRRMGDYIGYSEKQRVVLEKYDNATLYNDSIVSTMFHAFDTTNALGFYFPDHGLDLYETQEDFFGHARREDPASIAVGVQIPFFVYVSPLLAEQDSALVERIKAEHEQPLCTDHLVEYLCRILKISFKQ